MAEKITRFRPNSCACVVDYSWDDEKAPEEIVLTPVNIEPCEIHAPVLSTGLPAAFEAILAHNRAAAAQAAAQADTNAKE